MAALRIPDVGPGQELVGTWSQSLSQWWLSRRTDSSKRLASLGGTFLGDAGACQRIDEFRICGPDVVILEVSFYLGKNKQKQSLRLILLSIICS